MGGRAEGRRHVLKQMPSPKRTSETQDVNSHHPAGSYPAKTIGCVEADTLSVKDVAR